MGLVGPQFVGGTGALALLLAAEVVAATAVVSEAALIYMARHRNLVLSMMMIGIQIGLTLLLLFLMRQGGYPGIALAVAPALALALALTFNSIVKSQLLRRLLRQRIATWRPALIMASAVAVIVGSLGRHAAAFAGMGGAGGRRARHPRRLLASSSGASASGRRTGRCSARRKAR
jgi:hypothetical protein